MCKLTTEKTLSDICCEWDLICEQRQREIDQGRDISLTAVTGANLIKHIKKDRIKNVIDVGCGTGYLSFQIAAITDACKGIDVSGKSIEIARQRYHRDNLTYEQCAIEKYIPPISYDGCVSNMVLMSDPNWKESLIRIFDLLSPEGRFYCVIAHPWFWPKYKGFDSFSWFNYNSEAYIENTFSISLGSPMGISTFIHRPLESYYHAITHSGFSIDQLEELYPLDSIPPDYRYPYPRFLLFCCKKSKTQ